MNADQQQQQQSQSPAPGLSYLKTIPGKARVVQEICNLIGFICLLASGVGIGGIFYILLAVGGLIFTGVLLAFYITNVVEKIQLPWRTVELAYTAVWGLLFIIFSIVVVISVNPGHIIAGIVGFIAAAAYLIDAYHVYRR